MVVFLALRYVALALGVVALLTSLVIALIYISPNLIALQAYYVTMVENGPILSSEYSFPLLATIDPPCSAVSLRQLSYLFRGGRRALAHCDHAYKSRPTYY